MSVRSKEDTNTLMEILNLEIIQAFSGPISMLLILVGLFFYRFIAKRSSWVPELPLNFFVLYFVLRIVTHLSTTFAPLASWQKWLGLSQSIVITWATIAITFHVITNLIKRIQKREIPKITRDFILMISYAVVAFILLRTEGNVNLASLITTSAVLTAVIGLAAQSTLSNLFSGLILQMEQPFTLGDWIKYGEHIGKVVGITWKSTKILTRSNALVYIPNTDISTQTFTNYSQPDRRVVANLELGLEYSAEPNKVRQLVQEVLAQYSQILSEPKPSVMLKSFDDFAIIYLVRFWHHDFGGQLKLMAEVRNQLWYALKRAGIKIPFPIRDVHVAHEERLKEAKENEALQKKTSESIRKISLLEHLSDKERAWLAPKTKHELYGQNEFIVRQDEPGDSLYFIERGSCEVMLKKHQNKHESVATLKSGYFFGEMSLLTGEKRKASVRAKENCELISVCKTAFCGLIENNPKIAEHMALVAAKRQASLDERQTNVIQPAVTKRLAEQIRTFFGISN